MKNQYSVVWILLAVWCLAEFAYLFFRENSNERHSGNVCKQHSSIEISQNKQRAISFRSLGLLAGTLAMACLVFRSFLSLSRLDQGDWNYLGSQSYLARAFPFQSVWTFGQFGNFDVASLRLALPTSLITLLAKIGFSFSVSERVVYVLPFLLFSTTGASQLLRYFTRSSYLPYVGSLLFTVNFVTVNWYAGGWYPVLLAYSLLPWQILAYLKWRLHKEWRYVILSALIVGLISTLDIRIAIVDAVSIGILVLVHLKVAVSSFRYYQKNWQSVVRGCWQLLTLIAVVTLIMTPLLLAEYRYGRSGIPLPSSYLNVSNLNAFSFYNIIDTLNFFDPWWPRFQFFNTSTLSPLPIVTIGIFLICSFALVRTDLRLETRRLRLAGFTCLVLGSELASGSNSPIPQINVFLWQHIPGFDLFRNPELWNPLIAVGFLIILIGLLPERSNGANALLSNSKASYCSRYAQKITLIFLVVLVVSQTLLLWRQSTEYSPLNLGSGGSTSNAVLKAQDFLSSRSGYVLWLPFAPLSTTDAAISSLDIGAIATAGKLSTTNLSQLQFGGATSTTTESPLSWLSLNVEQLKTLLAERDIGYIVLDQSPSYWSTGSMQTERSAVTHNIEGLHLPILFSFSGVKIYLVAKSLLVNAGTANPTNLIRQTALVEGVGVTTFGPVGNSDNYDSLSASKAGLVKKIKNCDSPNSARCLDIGIRVGAAITQALLPHVSITTGSVVKILARTISTAAEVGESQIAFLCDNSVYASQFESLSNKWTTDSLTFQYLGHVSCHNPSIGLAVFGGGAITGSNYNPPTSLLISGVSFGVQEFVGADNSVEALSSSNPNNVKLTNISFANNGRSKNRGEDAWSISLPSSDGKRVVNLWTNFNVLWSLTCNGESQVSHYLLNGWANAFLLSGGQSINCTLNFLPQGSFDVSLVVSWIVFTAALSFVLWAIWDERRQKRDYQSRLTVSCYDFLESSRRYLRIVRRFLLPFRGSPD